MEDTARLARSLAASLGGAWTVRPLQASGFCSTWHAAGCGELFVKSLPLGSADVLEAEADGLRALGAAGAIRVPAVAGCWRDEAQGVALLAIEWLALRAPDAAFGARFGEALGRLHAARRSDDRFGWHRDNRLGATPQRNGWSAEGGLAGWVAFFARERLGRMAQALAGEAAHAPLVAAVHALATRLPCFFEDGHEPRPSLIHGDLWSGNWGVLADGTPVVYDPAVSCSDAEAELAMMELFGQPPSGFWAAYRGVAGLHDGYPRRRGLYQLYHLLNHTLLFGGGYARQALALAQALLSGARSTGSSRGHPGR